MFYHFIYFLYKIIVIQFYWSKSNLQCGTIWKVRRSWQCGSLHAGSVEDRRYMKHNILNGDEEFQVIVSTWVLTNSLGPLVHYLAVLTRIRWLSVEIQIWDRHETQKISGTPREQGEGVYCNVAFWCIDACPSRHCEAELAKRWIFDPLIGNVSWVQTVVTGYFPPNNYCLTRAVVLSPLPDLALTRRVVASMVRQRPDPPYITLTRKRCSAVPPKVKAIQIWTFLRNLVLELSVSCLRCCSTLGCSAVDGCGVFQFMCVCGCALGLQDISAM